MWQADLINEKGDDTMGRIFGNMFDFNKDGKIDGFERAMEFMFIGEMVKDDSGDEDEFAEDNDY